MLRSSLFVTAGRVNLSAILPLSLSLIVKLQLILRQKQSQTIQYTIEDDCTDTSIPLPNVTTAILAKVFEYYKRHVEAAPKVSEDKAVENELKAFDVESLGLTRLPSLILFWSTENGWYIDTRRSYQFSIFDIL